MSEHVKMVRICPVTDANCRYGPDCRYSIDRYTCKDPFTEKPMAKFKPEVKVPTAADAMLAGAKTWQERQTTYGSNYVRAAGALAALFPDGVTLKTQKDHERFQIFNLIVVKLSRYTVNWSLGGHKDSVHDAMVYAALLESIDSD